jgi:hypothetical protein
MIAALALCLAPLPELPAQESAPRPARVAAAQLDAHAFFDARSPVVASFTNGTPLRVLEVKTPWARVQAPGGFDLWVHGEFVSWKGSDGTITAGRVNARPLPSDNSQTSAPLGRFDKGDAVVRTGHEGAWIKVRAPERISAWVKLEEIEILGSQPEGWEDSWNQAAAARAPVREDLPVPQPVPEPPQPAPNNAGTGPAPAAAAVVPAVTAAPAAAKREVGSFPAAQIAKEPTRWLELAQRDLNIFRSALADSYGNWQDARAQELEAAFSNVLWHGTQPADLDGARRSLSGLDALRRSYGDWLATQHARSSQAGDTVSVATITARQTALHNGWGTELDGAALLCGWVEFRPAVNANRPFAVVRGGEAFLVHDFTDRWHLADYAGREIVVRGEWRVEEGAPEKRVLAITELRVLPALETH